MSSQVPIDKDAIKQLSELLNEHELSEIEIQNGNYRIRLARTLVQASHSIIQSQSAPIQSIGGNTAAASNDIHPGTVKSPMVGTVYMSPEPGSPQFIQVGSTVSEGQTLLIIEAMKVMNPIKAARSGRISQIYVKDAQPVEFGEPLVIIE
jgi:acetyl-CoA carboxylase biotin carboxyl carrier protein